MRGETLPLCKCGCGQYVLCRGRRFIRGHNKRHNESKIREKLLEHIEIDENGCWNWQRCRGKLGNGEESYGKINVNRKPVPTHRLSYSLFVGPIPKGMCVLHQCDNMACSYPLHLRLGTFKDNMVDREQRGRANRVTGNEHWTRKNPERIRRAVALREARRRGAAK